MDDVGSSHVHLNFRRICVSYLKVLALFEHMPKILRLQASARPKGGIQNTLASNH